MLTLLSIMASAAPQAPADVVRYTVKSGDTPSGLAERYLARPRGWRDLLRLARSHDARRLPTGLPLAIPVDWLRGVPDRASLASYRGSVSVSVGGRVAAPRAGMALSEGAELATAADSFVTLILPNGSRVALPSQSRVRIAQLRKLLINGTILYRFELKQGRVDTRVTPLSGPGGRYSITTPVSMTAVRGTDYAVSYDTESRTAGTKVFAGAVAVSPPNGTEPLLVPKNFGALTNAEGRNEKVELLSAPNLVDPGKAQHDDLVTFDLTPVAGATSYHILLATDAGFVDSYHEQDSVTPHFEVKDVPDGNHFVRISAIAANGLEGQRQSYAFTRQLASIHGQAEATPDGYKFKWFSAGEGKRHFHLRIFADEAKGTPVVDEVGLVASEVMVKQLPPGVYFWQVATIQTGPEGLTENWTDPERLTIAAPSGR